MLKFSFHLCSLLQKNWNKHLRRFTSAWISTSIWVLMRCFQLLKILSIRWRHSEMIALCAASLAVAQKVNFWAQIRLAMDFLSTKSGVFSMLTDARCWRASPNFSSSRDTTYLSCPCAPGWTRTMGTSRQMAVMGLSQQLFLWMQMFSGVTAGQMSVSWKKRNIALCMWRLWQML